MSGRETYTMDELNTLIAAGFSAEFICRDLHAKPRSVARRLHRHNRRDDAAMFDKYDRELNGPQKKNRPIVSSV
jgi:hypothetical protein